MQHIGKDSFIECLSNLCKSLWKIICCYREISKWHIHKQPRSPSRGLSFHYLHLLLNLQKNYNSYFLDSRSEDVEASMAAQYVRQKLEMGRVRVWHDVQIKVAILISVCESSNFKFDDFLDVLDLVDR